MNYQKTSQNKLLLDSTEAAAMLSLSERKVKEMIQEGVLPSIKIDRCRRISVSSIIQWIEERESDANENMMTDR